MNIAKKCKLYKSHKLRKLMLIKYLIKKNDMMTFKYKFYNNEKYLFLC